MDCVIVFRRIFSLFFFIYVFYAYFDYGQVRVFLYVYIGFFPSGIAQIYRFVRLFGGRVLHIISFPINQ